jgi:hypothetical protein
MASSQDSVVRSRPREQWVDNLRVIVILLDKIVNNLFSVGLSLQASIDLPSGAARIQLTIRMRSGPARAHTTVSSHSRA